MTASNDTPRPNLRERKKTKVREAAIDAAARLFDTRGYAETTLADVCEKADISLRTLLRYFPTKEELALARDLDRFNAFAEGVSQLPLDKPVLEFWRMFEVSLAQGRDAKFAKQRAKLMEGGAPALPARLQLIYLGYENLLAERLSLEAGQDPETDLYAQLLAGLIMAGTFRAYRRWMDGKGKDNAAKMVGEVIDWAQLNFPPRNKVKPVRS